MESASSPHTTSPTLLGRLGQSPSDQAAWAAFIDRYGPRIFAWCQHWNLQQADAEDVTQIVLVKLSRCLSKFAYDPGKSFRAWLKTLTRNAVTDFVESRKADMVGSGDTQMLQVLASAEARDNLEARLEREFDNELLDEAMARVRLRVTPEKWEAFRLLAIDQLPGAEVAQRVNMKVATVYVVRGKVQKMLEEEVRKLDQAS
jgi:RNA polymerase sigma factor (sigma-70 family)